MSDVILEIARAVILGVLVLCLCRINFRRADFRHHGWRCMLVGFALLLFGSLIDITDEFESLNHYRIVGDTPIQAFLEKIVGYTGGFLLVTVGLLRWLPVMASFERINGLVDELQQTNIDLNRSNEKLRTEIAARHAAEQKTHEDGLLLKAILESNQDGILVVQNAKRVLLANGSFCDLWDVPEQLVKEGHDHKLLRWVTDQVADPVTFLAEVERLYASSEESRDIVHVADGRIVERYSWPLSSHEIEDGRIWVFRDITERYRTESELRKLGRAVEQSSSTVIITDLEGRIEYVNRAFEQTTGYSREEAIGQTPAITSSGRQSADFYRELWETVAAGRQWQGEFQNRRKDGRFYWQSATISPVVDEDGVTRHYVSVQEDVTEKRRVADELKTYAAALEEANQTLRDYSEEVNAATRAKSEFLANMSHEIRTPMTAILGYSDILLSEGEQQTHAERMDALQTIQRNGQYLLDLINDILDLSKIEAGKIDLETVECSPAKVVSDVISLMRVRADAKNLPLNAEYEGLIPETIQTDPLRLRQVLINLLGNAIKFTELGHVQLKVRALTRLGASPKLLFEVCDTGIGLSPEQTKKLFQPFHQADTSTSRRFGGTGLGLTISKRLAEMLGGDITLTSRYGEGSTFSLTIDPGPLDDVPMENVTDRCIAALETPDEPTPIPKDLSCRILLAEDGHDNQRLIAFLLRKAGAEVDVAENGQIAFDKAVQAQSENRPYDVVLMDMQMPVMDGYQATRELRDSGYTRPVVALTANAMAGDREKCLAAGCDEFATKPIDRQALIQSVRAVLETTAPASPGN